MQLVDGGVVYSASDLNNDLECRRLTWLEVRAACGELERPEAEASVKLIAEKGEAHEARYRELQHGRLGDEMVLFRGHVENTRAALEAAEAETVAAMARGARLIYQATFFDGTFRGRTDFLRRVEHPCARWPWSYEVVDTKLALSPKAYFVLQLCNYSEHVARVQGSPPLEAHVVLGSGVEASFRLDDYAAFYRRQKRAFLARAERPADVYPAEVGHCAICRWTSTCEAQRERDDYLGLVAWMRQSQIDRLAGEGITTLAALGAARDDQRPFGMTEATFATLRAQAALQHKQRTAFAAGAPGPRHFYELLDAQAERGFEQLPPPDAGDVYFDMEGDPLYTPERGLEYLFGVYAPDEDRYTAFWARDLAQERRAFEDLMDYLTERRARFPNMHVYHYAPYETVALRRLMGSYGTREAELDRLLRGRVFVDLFAVVRQAVRISQPGYSIKKLEPFYGMVRRTDVRRGDDSIVNFELWLTSREDAILDDIERYNEDDCRSTFLLHRWLQERRLERARTLGRELPWRARGEAAGEEREKPVNALAERLLAGLPDPATPAGVRALADDVKARWLLGHLVQYHRREAKPVWWKMFDRHENVDRLTEFDHEALGDLTLCADVPPYALKPRDRNLVYTYAFPDQLHNVGSSPQCPHTKRSAGSVVGIDDARNRIRIKVAGHIVPRDLRALIPGGPVPTDAQEAALEALALAYEDGSLRTCYPAIWDILVGARPRFTHRPPGARVQPAIVSPDAVAELVGALDRSYLFVQGPPGSGKSTIGAEVIVTLLAAGKRVGVVARSHAAVHHLLHKVERRAHERGVRFTGYYKDGQDDAYTSPLAVPLIAGTANNGTFVDRPHDLAGGTPWLFAREDRRDAYDVLFVDEAGQLALGDVLASATAARNVVLLGDPLQLAQVSQGSHPAGTGASVLEHLLGAGHTVPPDRGVFLDVSYRMHPEICSFISEAVYDGRLAAAPGTERHRVAAPGAVTGSGLRYVPVEHAGNARESAEEAACIADAIAELLRGEVTPPNGPGRPLTAADILVVTPYNAQRGRIEQTLAARGLPPVAVGTVDKFQGQEAAVVFYSMATSSGADVPRDLSFLFERNRFNVAVSRAQALAVLVCSPQLLEVRCATPAEMKLAGLLCAYVERATEVEQLVPS